MYRYAQCLLFVVHKNKLEDFKAPLRKTGRSPASQSQLSPEKKARKRTELTGYALAPYFIRYDTQYCEMLARCAVEVLQTPELATSLTEAVRSDRVEFFEIILCENECGELSVFGNECNEDVLSEVLIGHEIHTNVHFLYFSGQQEYTSVWDENNLNIIGHLASYGPDIKCGNERGGTLLHLAIKDKNKALVRLLLDKGAEVDARTNEGRTPLHVAIGYIRYGNTDEKEYRTVPFLKHLIENGANVNATITNSLFYEGVTPLHLALESRQNILVRFLLNHGASVNDDSALGNVLQLAFEGGDSLFFSVMFHCPDVNNAKNQAVFIGCLERGETDKYEIMKDFGFRHGLNDAKDVKLLTYALYGENLDLLTDLFNWGAAVYYDRSQIPDSHEFGCIEEILLTKKLSSKTSQFLLEIIDCSVLRPSLMSKIDRLLRNRIFDMLVSIDLDLTSILNKANLVFLESEVNSEYFKLDHWIYLIKEANLRVNETFMQDVDRLDADKFPSWFLKALRSSCIATYEYHNIAEEAAALKTEAVGDLDVSYHEFLEMSQSKIVRLLKNERVSRALQAESYKRKFPKYYSSIIERRSRKALRRRTLIDKGTKMFNYLQPELPDEVSEMILNYLSTLDLMVFANICKLPA